MIQTIRASTFFQDNYHRALPTDSPPPDIRTIISRARVLNPSQYPLSQLKEIFLREHVRLTAGKHSLDAINSIDNQTVFVVTGQQAGLFGGPLYTLYKAMHAVRLAERITEETGIRTLPLFWAETDDHDFEEVRSLGMRTSDGSKCRVEYTPENYKEGMPVGSIVLDDTMTSALDFFIEHFPSTERYRTYGDMLRQCWQAGRTWADAFLSQMLVIFHDYGLIMLNPRWQGIKGLFRDIVTTELTHPLMSTSLVNEAAEKRGKDALRKVPDAINLFLDIEGVRCPLCFAENTFTAGGVTYTQNELLALAELSPERFSPSVVLRPLCQDAILPVAAYIAGPGERIYLNQIKEVYSLFGVNGSVVWPRASFTIIDQRIQRYAEKEGIVLTQLFEDEERIFSALTRENLPETVKDRFESLTQSIDTEFDELAEVIGSVEPTLADSVRQGKGKSLHIIEKIKEQTLRAHRAKQSQIKRRISAAHYFLFPKNSPQERWFGADTVIPLLGESGLDELINLTSPEEENHRMVILE